MRFRFRISAWLAALIGASSMVSAQQPQVPVLSATSLQRGNSIARNVRSTGLNRSEQSKEVSRAGAVKVVLRSFSKPKTPYEVQCFFSAKDAEKNRYIFDVKKTTSSETFDEMQFSSRELFGGSEKVDQRPIYHSGPTGGGYSRTTVVPVFLTKTVAGSSFEGWIVRVLSAGKIVRLDASLPELKSFAEKNPAVFDRVADDPKAGQAKREK